MNRRDRRRGQRGPGAGTSARRPGLIEHAERLLAGNHPTEAEKFCRQALVADRSSPDANRLLARALRAQGRLDEAMLCARRAAASASGSAAAHAELGAVLAAQDRIMEAVRSLEHAVELDSANADAHNRLGAAMLDLGQLDKALASFRRVAALLPDHPAQHANIGLTLARMGQHKAALEAYDRAITLNPDNSQLRYNRAFSRLATGDLVGGWTDHEHGFAAGERRPARHPDVPVWDGSDLAGRTIMVWREQGLGDELRHASCYREVAECARDLVIESDPRLTSLFARSFPTATVRAQTYDQRRERETGDFGGIDLHCPAGSLPRHLRTSLEAYPRHDGFLRADPDAREQWRQRLSAAGRDLKVGICWRSMNLATDRLRNYTTLDEWDPVLALPQIDFVNLQYGDREQTETELATAETRFGGRVHRWADVDYTDDLEAVAALIAELDVVVSVNTAVSVLAGALGTPCLLLTAGPLPFHHGLDHDPWTPSVSVYPRAWNASWSRAMEKVAGELSRRSTGRA